jgi:hypothetical protein
MYVYCVCLQRKHPLSVLGTAWRSQEPRSSRVPGMRNANIIVYCRGIPGNASGVAGACGSPSARRDRGQLQFFSASLLSGRGSCEKTSYARVSLTPRKSVHVSGCLSSPVLYETTPTGPDQSKQIHASIRQKPPSPSSAGWTHPSQSLSLCAGACPTQTDLRT